MTEQDRVWYFGADLARHMPKYALAMPVPVAAECAAGCGHRIRIDDHGLYLYDPSTRARAAAHWECITGFLHTSHS